MANEQLIESYLQGPRILHAIIQGMTLEQLRARPVPGKWSTLEVVCHLADFDPILADRMKRVIAEDRPQLIGADENRFAVALSYQDRDVTNELRIIDLTRDQLGLILRKLPDSAWQRTGLHSERGELSLQQILEGAVNHILHHVKFIHEKRQALSLPNLPA